VTGCGRVFLRQHLGQFLDVSKAPEAQWNFLLLFQIIFKNVLSRLYIQYSLNVKVVFCFVVSRDFPYCSIYSKILDYIFFIIFTRF